MKGIFISYRRDDTASEARLLYNYLRREFGDGRVFMDVEALREPGADFVDAIHASLASCDAVLAVIGRDWAGMDAKTGRSRLDSPGDFIRMELSIALQRGVRVVPVLVAGASMPPVESLPEDLQALTRRQAVTLSHEDWDYSIGKLVDGLAKILKYKRQANAQAGGGGARRRWPLLAGGAVLAVVAMIALSIGTDDGRDDHRQVSVVSDTLLEADPPVTTRTGNPVAVVPMPSTQQSAQPQVQSVPVSAAPPPAPALASTAQVARTQTLLTGLGYRPGAADGVIGRGTSAAVAAFQNDHGVAGPRGEISASLLAALERVAAQRQAAEVAGIAGTWYTEEGVGFQVQQQGSSVAFHLNGVRVGEGNVDVDGMELFYDLGGGLSGYILASIDEDGRHIRGMDTSVDGTMLPIVLHHEHLAQ